MNSHHMPKELKEPPEIIPISLLNDFLYCHRRAALKLIEGWRSANEHTIRGDIVHEHADLPGYEVARGVKLLRALPIFSERLGLNGKCDIVEQRPDGSLFPVEFKTGRRRRFENDDAQLCAQALCLEEMFSQPIHAGAIFHADSKRRREVAFTPELRGAVLSALDALRALLTSGEVPPPVFKDACEECSLFGLCLPKAIENQARLGRAARQLFEV